LQRCSALYIDILNKPLFTVVLIDFGIVDGLKHALVHPLSYLEKQYLYTGISLIVFGNLMIFEMSIAAATTLSSTSSSAVALTGTIMGGVGGALIAILLVSLLSSRELITASSRRSKKALAAMDAAILPLLVVFSLTIVFQVLQIVSPLA